MKRTVILLSLIALLYAGLHMLGSTRVPPLYTIRTEMVLPASPEHSWQVLSDFASYAQWNPYLTRVEGTLAAGETVSFTLVDENFAEPLDLAATLGEVTANERFYWVGRLGIQGLFDTRHVFELSPRDDGNTDLFHYEEFRGVIPALLPQREKRSENTRAAFERMNLALLERLQAGEG
jgi:hypothetical protein